MRGLTAEERRILMPGPPGEWAPDFLIEQLIANGRAAWSGNDISDLDQSFTLEITARGRLALEVCPIV